jgi:hypothetical protein
MFKRTVTESQILEMLQQISTPGHIYEHRTSDKPEALNRPH